MKTIQKDKVLLKGTAKRVLLELEILMKAQGNYLCGIESFFHTEFSLCLVMPFLQGGELHKILSVKDRFSEKETKFYAAQIILGV